MPTAKRTAKRMQREIVDKLEGISLVIHSATPSQLDELESWVRNLGPSNCWWLTFRAQPALLALIRDRHISLSIKRKGTR